jgi:hypothetical protein
MGWASAGDIFDPVAQALIDLNAPDETKRRVLGTLISKLQDGDWDTEDESLGQFRHDPVIVALFYERGVGNTVYGAETEGVIDHDEARDEWVLKCDGRNGCGELGRGAGMSTVDHDRLVRQWADHDREQHGGDGVVDEYMLLNPQAAA